MCTDGFTFVGLCVFNSCFTCRWRLIWAPARKKLGHSHLRSAPISWTWMPSVQPRSVDFTFKWCPACFRHHNVTFVLQPLKIKVREEYLTDIGVATDGFSSFLNGLGCICCQMCDCALGFFFSFRESTSCSGRHQRTPVRPSAAVPARHPGPDSRLQVH